MNTGVYLRSLGFERHIRAGEVECEDCKGSGENEYGGSCMPCEGSGVVEAEEDEE